MPIVPGITKKGALCQNCAKLVDSDLARFTIELLQEWKIDREAEARRQIGRAIVEQSKRELIVQLQVGEFVEVGVRRTPKFLFKVSNPHQRPATIWGAGVDAPECGISAPALKPELLVIPPRPALPRQITDGEGLAFSEDIDYFVSELRAQGVVTPVQVVGYVTDALGNRHESKAVIFALNVSAG